MRVVNILLLLSALPYISRAQYSDYYEPWNDNEKINCTFRLFPSNDSVSRAFKAFQEVPIIYNSEICSSNPFELSRSRTGAEVIEGKVSCADTAQVGIQAEFADRFAIRYFQIRCVAEFPLELNNSVPLPFLASIESWKGEEVFGMIGQMWTAQVTGTPSSWGEWSTDWDHEWSLSSTYVAYSKAEGNFNLSIDLSLRSNSSGRQGNLPMYPEFTFVCSLSVSHRMEDNEAFTWKRTEGLSVIYANQNCEVDSVSPAEGVGVEFLRKGGMFGRVSCIGPSRIKMLAGYLEETRITELQLDCLAGFPIDIHLGKAKTQNPTIIQFEKTQIRQNPRYTALTVVTPGSRDAWIVDDKFQSSSFSSEYTFYSILDPTVNISINLAFQSTTNKSRIHNIPVSELQVYSGENATLLCSSTSLSDPPVYFVSAGGENPSESRELVQCLQSDNVADCAGEYTAGSAEGSKSTRQQKLLPSGEHGLAYCMSKQKQTWLEFFTPITTYTGKVGTKMKQALGFRLENPVYVGVFRTTIRAKFGMNSIGCGAAYWNNARNATAILPIKIKSLSEASSPGFLVAESKHLVNLGRPFHLNCLVDFGEPVPVYWWRFYGKNGLEYHQYRNRRSFKPLYKESNAIREGKAESNLTIEVFGEDMEGEYVCTAVNPRGNSSHRFKVIVDSESNSRKYLMYAAVIGGLLAFIGPILVAVTRKFYFRQGQLSQLEIKLFENGDKNGLSMEKFAHENAQFMPYDRQYEIDWKDFQISYHEKLGEGAYGIVFKGHMVANAGRTVAIKTLRDGADKTVLLALLSELKVMIHLDGHENVVKLMGACTSFLKDGRVYLLVEFCPTGSVESYIRKIDKNNFGANQTYSGYTSCDATPEWDYDNVGTLSNKDLIGWGIQIARGMQHLESKKVVHGDLAARNILLCSKSQVKITDFGLSRQLLNYENYVKKSKARLPWRWLALETLKSLTFTHKSDVWGYGVTLWEIFTLGMVPYPGMAWTTEFVSLLEQNLRLHRPQYASENLYKIMYRCWDPEPRSRPNFQELEGLLLNLHD